MIDFNMFFSDTFYLTSEAELMKDISKIDDRLHDLMTMSDVESVSIHVVNSTITIIKAFNNFNYNYKSIKYNT